MKKILKFQKCEENYQVMDGEEVLFSINIAEMKFDIKDFYYAFFNDYEEIGNIEIQNTITSDKVASRVYDCIAKLYDEIVDEFNKVDFGDQEKADSI